MLRCKRAALVAVLSFFATSAWGQATVPDEYVKLIQNRGEVIFGNDGFGDRIDFGSGGLEIIQTDVDLPGSNALPVRVTRRFKPADPYADGHFRRWTIDLPSVHGVFPGLIDGWQVDAATPTDSHKRCSMFGKPPIVLYGYGWYDPDDYWHGTFLSLPGVGDQELLVPNTNMGLPVDGRTYSAATKSGAAARCISLSSTSESGNSGEGFEVVAPDGLIYTLNHMVTTNQPSLRMENDWLPLPRKEYFLYPTRVTDRFGNTVTYTWNPSKPWQLLHITANDGRHLDFTYWSANEDWVASITDGTRVWQYAYSAVNGSTMQADTLTLPDGSSWSFRLSPLAYMSLSEANANCAGYGSISSRATWTEAVGATVGTITSPSGTLLTLSMKPVHMGRSRVAFNCVANSPYTSDEMRYHSPEPYLYKVAAVVAKSIVGPGLPPAGLTWNYSYGPSNNCWDGLGAEGVACTSGSPTTRQMMLTDPDGVVTRYTFGNRYNVDEGLLYKTEFGVNGASVLRTVDITYADSNAAPYGSLIGYTLRSRGDWLVAGRKHPQRKVVTMQQGRTFSWEVAAGCNGYPYCFDEFARPMQAIKTSTP